jgi:hypothetical protein
MANHTTKFNIGEIVYIRMEQEQHQWQILEIKLVPGSVIYLLSNGDSEKSCYEIELDRERDELKSLM